MLPQQVQDGQIRRHTAVGEALPFRIADALSRQVLAKLVEEPRFPYAQRSDQAHNLPPAGLDLIEDRVQQYQFPLSADKWASGRSVIRGGPRAGRAHAHHGIAAHACRVPGT